MSFTLTHSYMTSLMESISNGDGSEFASAIDPAVHWIIADPVNDPVCLTGTYNLPEWVGKVKLPLASRLDGVPTMKIESLDVVGQKAIVEMSGSAMQKNGKPYNNRFCWIVIFSEATGKIVTIREYLNSALVKEVMETNEGM